MVEGGGGGREKGSNEPPDPPLDQPLGSKILNKWSLKFSDTEIEALYHLECINLILHILQIYFPWSTDLIYCRISKRINRNTLKSVVNYKPQ